MKTRSLLICSRLALIGILLASNFSTITFAQSQSASGSIEGSVTDATGAVVPDAKVSARNRQTGFTRDGMTNSEGLYRLPLLQVGDYDLTIDKQGFSTVKREAVKIEVG